MNIAPVRNEEPLMPADPFTLLQSDHRQVEALLKSLADSEQRAARERLVQQLTLAFDTHARFEEQAVYPHVIRVMDTATETEAEVEHALARDGLRKLAELVDAPGFGAAVEMLRAGITHHVKEEESEIFPALRSGLAASRRQARSGIAGRRPRHDNKGSAIADGGRREHRRSLIDDKGAARPSLEQLRRSRKPGDQTFRRELGCHATNSGTETKRPQLEKSSALGRQFRE
jgi:Hemerythrin HHE cation binding domain